MKHFSLMIFLTDSTCRIYLWAASETCSTGGISITEFIGSRGLFWYLHDLHVHTSPLGEQFCRFVLTCFNMFLVCVQILPYRSIKMCCRNQNLAWGIQKALDANKDKAGPGFFAVFFLHWPRVLFGAQNIFFAIPVTHLVDAAGRTGNWSDQSSQCFSLCLGLKWFEHVQALQSFL